MATQPSAQPTASAHESYSVALTIPCLNCGAPVQGVYCVACGQRSVDLDASTWHVVREALGDATDLDGRVLRTVRAVISPGQLTLEFLRGRRAPYVSPLKLFLFAGTVLTTTWIVTRGVDAHFYGLTSDGSAGKYIDTVVRGAMASGFAIAVSSWALGGGRRRLLDEVVFALHLVSTLAFLAATVIWLGTAWKVMWGVAAAVPQSLPALPILLFLPASVVGLAYLVSAVHRVHGGRWWLVALRSAVVAVVGVAAVVEVIVHAT